MVSVRTSIVPPGPRPPLADTPGTSPAVTTPQVTATIHDFAVPLGVLLPLPACGGGGSVPSQTFLTSSPSASASEDEVRNNNSTTPPKVKISGGNPEPPGPRKTTARFQVSPTPPSCLPQKQTVVAVASGPRGRYVVSLRRRKNRVAFLLWLACSLASGECAWSHLRRFAPSSAGGYCVALIS